MINSGNVIRGGTYDNVRDTKPSTSIEKDPGKTQKKNSSSGTRTGAQRESRGEFQPRKSGSSRGTALNRPSTSLSHVSMEAQEDQET